MSEYYAKLKDPRWFARREEILKRDKHTCVRCRVKNVKFQVHHTYYEMGLEPWDYPPSSLITVCIPCHEREDDLRIELRRLIGCVPPSIRSRIFGYVYGQYKLAFFEMGNAEEVFRFDGEDGEFIRGIADAVGMGIAWRELYAVAIAFDRKPLKVADAIEMRDFLNDTIEKGAKDDNG